MLVALLALTALGSEDCFPPCSPGYLCHESACIEACNPACGPGFHCSADRVCEPTATAPAAPPAPTPPASTGRATLCVFRMPGMPTKWEIAVDGISAGLIGSNKYRCFDIAAGRRVVRVTQVSGGSGFMAPGGTIQLAPSTTSEVDAPVGGTVGLLCDQRITAMSFHVICAPAGDAAAIEQLKDEHKPEDR
jgi:hypothetical protein